MTTTEKLAPLLGEKMSADNLIGVIEARDLVGRKIFGDGWIEAMSQAEKKLMEEYFPTFEVSTAGSAFRTGPIEACPPAVRDRLDRAVGRCLRMNAQWTAAEDWLKRQPLRATFGEYDRAKLTAAIANINEQSTISVPRPGPRATVTMRVLQNVRAEVKSGVLTSSAIAGMPLKTFGGRFKCGNTTAAKVKKTILDEAALRKLEEKVK